jgi:hypothetical protein
MWDKKSENSQVEVTPQMIEAGVAAYYANEGEGWNNPNNKELGEMLAEIFKAMSRRR